MVLPLLQGRRGLFAFAVRLSLGTLFGATACEPAADDADRVGADTALTSGDTSHASSDAGATGDLTMDGSASDTSTGIGTSDPDTKNGDAIALVDAHRWVAAAPEADLYPSHRPETVTCKPGTYKVEDGSFEVETGSCNYALFTQFLEHDLRAQQKIHIVAWHLQLTSPEPAQGHLVLTIGAETIFEITPAIPGVAQVYDVEATLLADHAAGEPIVLHLHNHGFNTWNLLHVDLLPH